MAKQLLKGNEAIAEAALRAGCRFYAGYPITPQNQIPEYMSKMMPKIGGTFIQAESEVSAINMLYGAAGAGARTMTSSSSPGISLKQEGISYAAGAELPMVIVNMVRGGSGLGSIQPAQSDYFQATRGGGHGDYRLIVLAPATVQEACDLMATAFAKAEEYRNPVMILGDGMLGQIMEPVELPEAVAAPAKSYKKDWAAGWGNRPRAIINSLFIDPAVNEQHNIDMQKKYDAIAENETRVELVGCDDAELVLVAYGTMARICKKAQQEAAKLGIKVGLVRPITLWPFPYKAVKDIAAKASVRDFLCVEMSLGQMIDDVKIGVEGQKPVAFYGRTGGMVPTVKEVLSEIVKLHEKEGK